MNSYQLFREIKDPDELEIFLKLRSAIYANSRMKSFISKRKTLFDFDSFDFHAHHFGFFENEKAIGYIRIVEDKHQNENEIVKSINLKYDLLPPPKYDKGEIARVEDEFPFLSYEGVPNFVKEYYLFHRKSFTFLEGSRLILLESKRSLQNAKNLIDFALVAALKLAHNKPVKIIIDCANSHEKHYERMGFSKIPGIESYYLQQINVSVLSLSFNHSIADSTIPIDYRHYYFNLLQEYSSTNQITIDHVH